MDFRRSLLVSILALLPLSAAGGASAVEGCPVPSPDLEGNDVCWRIGDQTGGGGGAGQPPYTFIRPGATITSPSACTVGFIVRTVHWDGLSFVTAGHCVHRVGEPVQVENVGVGRVDDFFWSETTRGLDWALVRIHSEWAGRVDARVIEIDGPCGADDSGDTQDVEVRYYGKTTGAHAGHRVPAPAVAAGGVAVPLLWATTTAGSGGDSGGPVVAWPSLKALGINDGGLPSGSSLEHHGTMLANIPGLTSVEPAPIVNPLC